MYVVCSVCYNTTPSEYNNLMHLKEKILEYYIYFEIILFGESKETVKIE